MKILRKDILNSISKKIFILLLLLLLYTSICAFSYVRAVSSDISNNLFRLHVIANSDSEEDQNLKYIVRDTIISYISNISKNSYSKEEIILIAKANISEIETIAKSTIINNGYDYDVKVSIGNFPFPTKTYGDISLPIGFYDALKIEIGSANRTELVVCNVPSSLFC